jgi:hypothetical protein
LSAFLTIPIDKSSTKDEIKKLVAKVTAIDDVVLVSWEHRKIPLIGRILVAGPQAIPDWPDERFDMGWGFDRVDASWQFLPGTAAAASWRSTRRFCVNRSTNRGPFSPLEIASGEN